MQYLEIFLLLSALSVDAFVASFGYGAGGIKMPYLSVQIINLICTCFLAVSLYFGYLTQSFINEKAALWISFSVLMIMGLWKLSGHFIKQKFKKKEKKNKSLLAEITEDYTKADVDNSKILSPLESVTLAVALSIDGISVGFGYSVSNYNLLLVIAFSLISDFIAIYSGYFFGKLISKKIKTNLSWISGVILIFLAVSKFIF